MSTTDLLARIQAGESEQLEFKRNTGMLKEAVQTICAMANRTGGTLVFGVEDNGTIAGQETNDDTLRAIAQAIQLNTEPRLYPNIQKITLNERTCIAVQVEESPIRPHFAYGRPWIRVGSTTQKMGRDEYELQLQQRQNGYGFDHQPLLEASIDDIEQDTLLDMMERANTRRNLNINLMTDVEEVLEKLNVLTTKKELTNAAVLLFGKQPARFFEGQFETKCGQFNTSEQYNVFSSEQLFRGNLFNQFQAIYDFILQRLDRPYEKDGTDSHIGLEMPALVIREAVVNMLVHRDYRTGIKNTVEIRPDVVRLSNPGHLFSPSITIERLSKAHPSRPGNKKIAHIMYLSGLFENWGSGTLSMIQGMDEAGLPAPVFEYDGGIFSVGLYRRVKEGDI